MNDQPAQQEQDRVGIMTEFIDDIICSLRKLERDGLVARTVFAEVPPRVEYALTPLGETLVSPITALAEWAIAHQDSITQGQRNFDKAGRH